MGARVVIRYGAGDGLLQMREIKASGGYLSGDPPRAHFGLGPHPHVARVEVQWPTGQPTIFTGPFAAGRIYQLTRERN